MSLIKDSAIIAAVANKLLNKTIAQDRVYQWRTTSLIGSEGPIINVVLDSREYTVDNSQGVYIEDRRLAIVLLVYGEEETEMDTGAGFVLDALDTLEEEVSDLIDRDYQTLGIPGILRCSRVSVKTDRENKERLYAARYLIYSIVTKFIPKLRKNDP